jgi:hypothetical protein
MSDGTPLPCDDNFIISDNIWTERSFRTIRMRKFENLISLGGMSPPAMTNDFLAYELTQDILWKIDLSLAFQAFHSETKL